MIKHEMGSSELQKRRQEEYEMQLFSFHSRIVYATLENIVRERILSTIKNLCETIEKAKKVDSENLAILKTNKKHLRNVYFKEAKPHLETIKNVINKCMAVPNNVLLEEDKYQRTQYSEIEFENIKQRLEDTQQRAKRATVLNAILKEELEVLEQILNFEENANKMCNVIENGSKCPDMNEQLYQLVDDYKQFSSNLFGITETEKMKYNTTHNLKSKSFDLDIL